jgi:hypothetical protein
VPNSQGDKTLEIMDLFYTIGKNLCAAQIFLRFCSGFSRISNFDLTSFIYLPSHAKPQGKETTSEINSSRRSAMSHPASAA